MSLAFMLEMAWKSLVISGAGLLLATVLRSRSAADRVALVRLSLVLLLGLPLISAMLPVLAVEEPAPAAAMLKPFAAIAEPVPAPAIAVTSEAPAPPPLPFDLLVPAIYAAGVLLVVGRLAAGTWTLARWTRTARRIPCASWRAAFARTGAAHVRLRVSDRIQSPLSWGAIHPVILIDPASLGRPEDAEAILAHELAHVARRDWLALVLARLTVALFWFNPLVWLLERALVHHAEEAADLQAVGRVEPVSYARTLLDCARGATVRAAPANAIASNAGLSRRMSAILDPRRRGARPGSWWTAAAMLGAVAISAPVAALELRRAAQPEPASAAQAAPTPAADTRPDGGGVRHDNAEAARRNAEAARARAERARQAATRAADAAREARAKASDSVREARDEADRAARAAAEAAREAAEADRQAARHDRVAREAARAAADEHRRPRPQTVGFGRSPALEAMGIDEEMIGRLAAAGYADLTESQLVAMKIFKVTPEFIAELASLGYGQLTPGQITALRIHRISTDDLREFARLGYPALTPNQLVRFGVHRVTPSFVRELASAGYQHLSPEELVRMRLFGMSAVVAEPPSSGPPPGAMLERRSRRLI